MRYFDQTFFCEKGKGIVGHIDTSDVPEEPWPITVVINESPTVRYHSPRIVFYLSSEQDLINFKNSVIEAYESFVRRRKEVKHAKT